VATGNWQLAIGDGNEHDNGEQQKQNLTSVRTAGNTPLGFVVTFLSLPVANCQFPVARF